MGNITQRKAKIILGGLDASGKTTIIYQMKSKTDEQKLMVDSETFGIHTDMLIINGMHL